MELNRFGVNKVTTFSTDSASLGEVEQTVTVQISMSVMSLLSEQLYASPLKAIEELVVNSWDADATTCLVCTPLEDQRQIVVFDDGFGMGLEAITDLWHIGRSRKGDTKLDRRKIGKFGIGKLASYAVASNATYVSKERGSSDVYVVTIDFDDLHGSSRDDVSKQALEIRKTNVADLKQVQSFSQILQRLTFEGELVDLDGLESWTIVILESLKDRSVSLQSSGRLSWVLSTAMPRASDFRLYLNGERIASSKDKLKNRVSFPVHDLPAKRLSALNKDGDNWHISDGALVSDQFPNGITGTVIVTERSLFTEGGKSEDLGRSHGFFIRVHGRLLNESDPYFGTKPQSFATWYRFAADLEVPDLNEQITAARDSAGQSGLVPQLRALLLELFREAREQSDQKDKNDERPAVRDIESRRQYVSRSSVERPLADALIRVSRPQSERSGHWSLLAPITKDDVASLLEDLYKETGERHSYVISGRENGEDRPFAELDPRHHALTLNENHPLSLEYGSDDVSRRLLGLFGVSEALLEVYLVQAGLDSEMVNELLRQRDTLLRSLAMELMSNPNALAKELRESARDGVDSKRFEIAVVASMRLMGFASQQKSNAGNSDGFASFTLFGGEDLSIALETKAGEVPELSRCDLAAVTAHRVADGAKGALFVAVGLPGNASDDDSQIAQRARQQEVSCWTVEQLATLVEAADVRRINTRDVFDIVTTAFAPGEVQSRLDDILTPSYSDVDVYREVIASLRAGEGRPSSGPRQIGFYYALVQDPAIVHELTQEQFTNALEDLAVASRGLITVDSKEECVQIFGDLDEIERRVASFTKGKSLPRRMGNFIDLRGSGAS